MANDKSKRDRMNTRRKKARKRWRVIRPGKIEGIST